MEDFFNDVPRKTLSRGREYFAGGHVIELAEVEPDHLYGAIVRGGEDYQVGLQFVDSIWLTDCTCPIEFDCKHAVAALLALRARAESGSIASTPKVQVRSSLPLAGLVKPSSDLEHKLLEKLGRKLRPDETAYVRRIEGLYHQAQFRPVAESDLVHLSGSIAFGSYHPWAPAELWPKLPQSVFLFWLHLAWGMRERRLEPPGFIQTVTDLTLIEKPMREWEHQKEVAAWKERFRNFDEGRTEAEPDLVELRLVILPEEARLHWRMSPEAPFSEMKQAHAKKLATRFEGGLLALAPDSLPLWSAAYKPWQCDTWWVFKYSDATDRPALNRLLRMPLAPEALARADGQPLGRETEPLRFDLRPPQNGNANYELALTAADGSPPPRILCMLAGRPTLYLTESSLFRGPPGGALGNEPRQSIPAEAIETADGLNFLHALGVPLPGHLQQRIRTAAVGVTIACGIKPIFPGSQNEEIAIAVMAQAPGLTEQFTARGWEEAPSLKRQKATAKGDSITVYDRATQKHFPRVLDLLAAKWDDYKQAWSLRLTKKVPEQFVPWLKSLPPEIELLLDKELATLRDEPVSGQVSLDVAEAGIDWFDLKVVLHASDSTLTAEELKLLLNARGGYVRLGKKGWRRLQFNLTPEEDEQLARLGLNSKDFSAEPQRFHALQLADEAAKKFLGPERAETIQRRASELKTRVAPPLPSCIRAEMRPYQMEGFHFLAYLTSNRFGGVLADDMGLGKTLQTLAWLAWVRETETAKSPACNPSLVICPKSVMDNWRAEAERFHPGLRVRLWRAEPSEELAEARKTADLIVLNYAQLRSLWPPIGGMQWFAAILDEAQYIKNPDSQTAQAARGLKALHRLALTGTPIENRLLDLWSIFGFAMPGVLGNRAHFLRRFDAKDDPLARRRLAARVRPFLLRRTKTQVAKDLPDRVEEDLLCEMEGEQQTLYRAELKRARQMLLGLNTNKQLNEARFNILTSLLRLRQICCHPALVDGHLRNAKSAKLEALEDLLEPLMEEGHKVLVFSQFVSMLQLLREKMEERNWPFFYLAGDTENRGELVQRFQSSKGSAVFLISLKAGGFGLNLTAASYVLLFDPWWNPAVENQAIDRTHRIGQSSKVIAYRLLIRESIEQKIRSLQKQKAALADDVLGEERFAQSLTLDDLQFLFSD